jgi:hypothetical protein
LLALEFKDAVETSGPRVPLSSLFQIVPSAGDAIDGNESKASAIRKDLMSDEKVPVMSLPAKAS